MNIILFGPPGAGKGTQAGNIVKDFYLYKISTGDLLRDEIKKNTDLSKKIKIYNYFEYVAGGNTFEVCKPDPKHLTNIVEILNGDLKKTLMIGDSENDTIPAKEASIPVILLDNGYTEKNVAEIYYDHLVEDFIGIEKIVSQYLND